MGEKLRSFLLMGRVTNLGSGLGKEERKKERLTMSDGTLGEQKRGR